MVSVLFVAGAARSGSTVLGATLGAIPGFVNIGELSNLWRLSLSRPDFRCGCDRPITACSFWSSVLESLRARQELPDTGTIRERQASEVGWRHIWQGLRAPRSQADIGPFVETVSHVYRGIAETTGAHCIVDTSKDPAFIGAVGSHPNVDGRVVLLVRDPRGHVASQHRGWRGKHGMEHPLNRQAAGRAVLAWTKANAAGEVLRMRSGDKGLRLRYEDFVDQPRAAISHLLRTLGLEGTLQHIDGRDVHVGCQHTAAGNPSRRGREFVRLSADDSWTQLLSSRDQAALFAVGLPLTRVYHYPLRAR